jgi:hypothetical protein
VDASILRIRPFLEEEDLHSQRTERREEVRADENKNNARPFLEEQDSSWRRSQGRQKKEQRKKFKEDFTVRPHPAIYIPVSKSLLFKEINMNGILPLQPTGEQKWNSSTWPSCAIPHVVVSENGDCCYVARSVLTSSYELKKGSLVGKLGDSRLASGMGSGRCSGQVIDDHPPPRPPPHPTIPRRPPV